MSSLQEPPASQRIKALLALRELLLGGAFAPGERLAEIPLCERLGVSRTPLRLALISLEHEGLVRQHGSGGYVVQDFSVEDVADAIELRGVLEGTAARFAAERLDEPAYLLPLREVVEEADRLLHDDGGTEWVFEDYVALNERFHALLLGLAGSAVLERSLEHVLALPFASPNALVSAQGRGARRWMTVAQEQHRAIVDAIAAREGARAEAVAREHARLARRNLEQALAADEPLATVMPGGSLVRAAAPPGTWRDASG
ncbi:GntR family transcriptional regulator [Egicoccus sp. AB-alg2]|uniref:GntR family transcriptional regulator n=1 Tax=Egicoccus sp. AB-alg2 TaxID=3242693 RepID=UPI00359DC0A2